jgi:hypothetical protein
VIRIPPLADPVAHHWRLFLVFSAIAVLWSWFQFFDDTAWTFPLLRGVVLAGAAAIAMLMGIPPTREASNATNPFGRLSLALAAITGTIACGFILAAGARSSKAKLVLVALLCVATLMLPMLGRPGLQILARLNRSLFTLVATVALLALTFRLWTFWASLSYPQLIDIGQTTLDAINAVRHGDSPYASPIDFNTPNPIYDGYKYLPAMMAVYAPLGVPFDVIGLRVTNLLLDGTTLVLIALLAARLAGRLAGAIAVAAYLLMPMLEIDLFRHGVTDPASIVPMLAALLLVDKRTPAWAGLAAGIAVSVKLFPGLLAVMCCLPATGRLRYAAAVLVGLTPCLWFLIETPASFVGNIFMFNIIRPPESTSIAAALVPMGTFALKTAAVLIVSAIGVTLLVRRVDLRQRCAFLVIGTVLAMISGPVVHNNYMLWWLPPFCVLLASHFPNLQEREVGA